MPTIKSVAFDMEGTIVDAEIAHHQAHREAAREVGVILSIEDCVARLPHFIGGPDEEVAKDIAKLGVDLGLEIDYHRILESKKHHYNLILPTLTIKPREGFLDFFAAIQDLGLRYTIGSLTNEKQAAILLEKSGLGRLFGYENIVLREHVARPKPAPDVWIETARRAGVSPESQLVCEDSPRGIQGAVEVNAYAIGMPTYHRPDVIKSLIDAGAKRVFLHWNEINPYDLITNINRERL